nr:DUF2141 domain-containing protein [uncultured Pseudomonas sp.]
MPQRILQTVTRLRYGLLFTLVSVCSPSHAGDILVNVDAEQANAPVYLALVLADQAQWPAMSLRQVQAQDGVARFAEVPPGRYALQLYRDDNGNGQLDLSPRGVPLEPVGFSANPPLARGKPTPLACLFEHGGGDTELQIELHDARAKR